MILILLLLLHVCGIMIGRSWERDAFIYLLKCGEIPFINDMGDLDWKLK